MNHTALEDRGLSRRRKKKPIGDDVPVLFVRRKEIERNQPLLVRDRLFFKARNALVEMTNRLFERGDG